MSDVQEISDPNGLTPKTDGPPDDQRLTTRTSGKVRSSEDPGIQNSIVNRDAQHVEIQTCDGTCEALTHTAACRSIQKMGDVHSHPKSRAEAPEDTKSASNSKDTKSASKSRAKTPDIDPNDLRITVDKTNSTPLFVSTGPPPASASTRNHGPVKVMAAQCVGSMKSDGINVAPVHVQTKVNVRLPSHVENWEFQYRS